MTDDSQAGADDAAIDAHDTTDVDAHDDVAEFVQYFIDEHQEFLSWIGTRVDDVDDGTMTLSVPYDEKLTNTRPNASDDRRADIHGGIAATLIDTAGGLALRTKLEDPLAGSIATINLNVNYLRPATGDLSATAEVIRAGSTVGVSEVTVESTSPDGETQAVATGQGAYRVFRDA